jgi:hypothetical protein
MNEKQRIYEYWTTQVLGATTTEEGGRCEKENSAKRRERNRKNECRLCQQNTWKRGRTVRLFGDEQPLEGGGVTYLHYAGHPLSRQL